METPKKPDLKKKMQEPPSYRFSGVPDSFSSVETDREELGTGNSPKFVKDRKRIPWKGWYLAS